MPRNRTSRRLRRRPQPAQPRPDRRTPGSTGSSLRDAEPIARVVPQRRFRAPRPRGRLREEADAALAELGIGSATIGGLKRRGAQHAFRDQRLHLPSALLVHHRRAWLEQDDLVVGLLGRAYRQPAKVVHPRVGVDLEFQLLGVELVRLVLVEHPDRRVRQLLDHRLPAPSRARRRRYCRPRRRASRKLLAWVRGRRSGARSGRVYINVKHAGIAGGLASRQRRAYAAGGSPWSSRKAELNEPRLWNPTSRLTSVTDGSPPRNSSPARSIRRRRRY